jgi:hypothetical protein
VLKHIRDRNKFTLTGSTTLRRLPCPAAPTALEKSGYFYTKSIHKAERCACTVSFILRIRLVRFFVFFFFSLFFSPLSLTAVLNSAATRHQTVQKEGGAGRDCSDVETSTDLDKLILQYGTGIALRYSKGLNTVWTIKLLN